VVLPLRHYESGAQLVTVTGARFAYGATIAQCCAYAAFDRVGNAQLLSRFGLAMVGGSDDALTEAKRLWVEEPALQGLRRYVEELFVEDDWVAGFLGLDLTDRLLYSLLYRHLDEAALLGGAGAYSLVAQHLSNWFADQRRWVDRLLPEWLADPQHGATNRAALTAIVDRRLAQAVEAVRDLAAATDLLSPVGAVGAVDDAATQLTVELSELGLIGIPAPRTQES
jgi:phenol/toluene 2-monooxygenase (NADH) P1/A1